MIYTVRILVRQRNAIGRFYPQTFTVCHGPANGDRSEVFAAWQAEYGDIWEPDHILDFAPAATPTETAQA